jgi:hypothetical protein
MTDVANDIDVSKGISARILFVQIEQQGASNPINKLTRREVLAI